MKHKTTKIASLGHKAVMTIERNSMISDQDAILVGVSGGPDSVALLLLLIDIARSTCFQNRESHPKTLLNDNHKSTLPDNSNKTALPCNDNLSFNNISFKENRNALSIRMGIAHINHCLRGDESDRDEAFVKDLSEKFGIPFHSLKIDVIDIAKTRRLSFEEAARNVRYSFYKETADRKHYTKVALGHNCDDNAELVLMNLLRGSGTKGVAGIPHVRDNWIIRPLIEISRQEILEYLNFKQQPYVNDSSNSEVKYLRNRIRHSLIPFLKEEYNPSVVDSLNRFSRIVMDEESWMNEEAERVFADAQFQKKGNSYAENSNYTEMQSGVRDDNISDKDNKIEKHNLMEKHNPSNKDNQETAEIHLALQSFAKIHPALAKRIVRLGIERVKGDLKRITLKHIDDVLNLVSSKNSGTKLHLPDKILIIKSRESICFKKESMALREIFGKNAKYLEKRRKAGSESAAHNC
ncbi:MAG: tRNA lysidine(34) synthetase TilS [Desulfamplus sp.]|nr:tRNA lysidine(34) synthetase TilS [Desulfamplus sp.]